MEMTRSMLLHLLNLPEKIPEGADYAFSRLQILDEAAQPGSLSLTLDAQLAQDDSVLALESLGQINQALQCHQAYLQWREQCLRYAQVEHDLNTLLEISSHFLDWDIWIVSPDYRMDAGSVDHFPGHLPHESQMSQAEVEMLYHDNPSFEKTFQLQGIQPYPQFEIAQAHLYYYNLYQQSLYLGRLLLLIPDSHVNSGAMALMEQLCRDVEHCYRFLYLHRRQNQQGYRFYDLWRSMLNGQAPAQQMTENALRHMGWSAQDRYEILFLKPVGYFYDQQTLKFYAVQMETAFPDTIAAELDGGLYALHNLSADQSQDYRQKLGEFLRENLFRVGISNPFLDFFDSPRYRTQAQEAMTLGQRRDPSLWRYDFCDYVSDYTVRQCLAQYPAIDLCPQCLRLLLEHEQYRLDGELVNTLYQYYTCQFNAQLAAQKLFIHRTTFFYRMNKIQHIASFHPEDPTETTQILLAFQALKQESPNNPSADSFSA